MTYNKPGTAYYKTAQNIKNKVEAIFSELEKYIQTHSELATSTQDGLFALFSPLANLEPPFPLLELLAKEDPLKDEMDLVLSAPPLESLFAFEFPEFKPPPPSLPPLPVPPKSKSKSGSKKQRARQGQTPTEG